MPTCVNLPFPFLYGEQTQVSSFSWEQQAPKKVEFFLHQSTQGMACQDPFYAQVECTPVDAALPSAQAIPQEGIGTDVIGQPKDPSDSQQVPQTTSVGGVAGAPCTSSDFMLFHSTPLPQASYDLLSLAATTQGGSGEELAPGNLSGMYSVEDVWHLPCLIPDHIGNLNQFRSKMSSPIECTSFEDERTVSDFESLWALPVINSPCLGGAASPKTASAQHKRLTDTTPGRTCQGGAHGPCDDGEVASSDTEQSSDQQVPPGSADASLFASLQSLTEVEGGFDWEQQAPRKIELAP